MVLVVALATLAAGCGALGVQTVRGSGVAGEREILLSEGVDEVSVVSRLDAEVVPGDRPSVRVVGDDNVVGLVRVREHARSVEVRMRPATRLRRADLRVVVTVPRLTALSVAGASDVRVARGHAAGDLSLSVSGASRVVGDIDAARVDVRASGASDVRLAGTAEQVDVHASGASEVDAAGVDAVDGYARASGSSNVRVRVSGELSANASAASVVRYAGNPRLGSVRTSAAGSVQPD
jgi:hypothetical protein